MLAHYSCYGWESARKEFPDDLRRIREPMIRLAHESKTSVKMKTTPLNITNEKSVRINAIVRGTAGIALALMCLAAGICPTAKLGTTDCGLSFAPNCNSETRVDCLAGGPSYPCVRASTPSNRKPGICDLPYDKTTRCEVYSNVVSVVYEVFRKVSISNGCDCTAELIGSCIVYLPCPISIQTTDPTGCIPRE